MSAISELTVENRIKTFVNTYVPYTNVVGLARSIIALGTLLTLLFNPIDSLLIKKVSGDFVMPIVKGDFLTSVNFFYVFGFENIGVAKWIAISILSLVISGYIQKISCFLHWWVSFSFFNSSVIIDGGDQIACVLTLLLIPICLFDNRKNHWNKKIPNDSIFNIISVFFLYLIQLQIAIIYFHAAVGKFGHPEWSDGTAMYYWLNHSYFGMPRYLEFVNIFLSNPYTVTIFTYGTLILEVMLFLALFASKRYKLVMLYIAIIFHLFIILFLGIFSFFFSIVGGLIIYLYPTNVNLPLWRKKSDYYS